MSAKTLPIRPKKKFEHQIFSFYEGDQELEYFKHLSSLINNHPQNKLKLKVIPKCCGGGDPRRPVKFALKNCDQNKTPFVVFDHDNKKKEFEEALDLSRKHKMQIGYSNINFDYWLALHKLDTSEIIYSEKEHNDAYVELVKKVYSLHKREDIKNIEVINKIMSKITFKEVLHAIDCAKAIENTNKSTDTKLHHTQNNNTYFSNPDMQIYEVVETLINKCIKKGN